MARSLVNKQMLSCLGLLFTVGLLAVVSPAAGITYPQTITTDEQPLFPALDPIPAIPEKKAIGSVPMGNPASVPETKMNFNITSGPFQPTWASITANYPGNPAWLREAKFGFWVHFGPQAAGESGDWYARRLYMPGQAAYKNHIQYYGHPSVSGYKEVLQTWNPTNLNPAAYVQLYNNAGARFLMIQGVHHDNYDLWDSKYQPWNSVNIGPKRDLLGEWATAAKAAGMRYGVTFHHEYTWWWWQKAFASDTSGTYAGVPYDGNLTLADGVGKWWQGYDPRLLYGIDLREYQGWDQNGWNPSQGILTNHTDYCNWYTTRWAHRIMDVVHRYDPDFIYTDGNSTQPYTGYMSATGYKCDGMQKVIADLYNDSLKKRGQVDKFSIVKFHPAGDRGVVTTFETNYPPGIKTDQPWIAENAVGDWYYAPYFTYTSTGLIRYLLECVSRDGCYATNIPMKPDGSLEPACVTMLNEVGSWMNINGPGIYGSRAWVKYGEGSVSTPFGHIGGSQANAPFTVSDFRFTVGKDGYLYAYCMAVPTGGTQIAITSLGSSSGLLDAPITSVSLLGYNGTLTWSQDADALRITCPSSMSTFKTAICFKIGPTSIIKLTTPTGLVVTSTDSAINLTWDPYSSAATYTVKRATSIVGPFTPIANGLTNAAYKDTTAQANTPYYYTVAVTTDTRTSADCAAVPGLLTGQVTWQSQDIGSVVTPGSLIQSDNCMLIKGSGSDIWGNSDGFYYVYKNLKGDGSITVKVESMTNTNSWAKAGVMIRESLDANSAHAILFMSPSNGVALQGRTTTGGSSSGFANPTGMGVPYWLRLVRSGSTITGYRSTDGATWTSVGSVSINMVTNAYIGLAVCGHSGGALNTAMFSNIETSVDSPISDLLKSTSGTRVNYPGKPVILAPRDATNQRTTNYFYIEDPDRSAAIRVEGGAIGYDSLSAGQYGSIKGSLQINPVTNEPYIALSAAPFPGSNTTIGSLGINTRSALTDTLVPARLVKLAGKVTSIASDKLSFTISDGYTGVNVIIPSNTAATKLSEGNMVAATGVIAKSDATSKVMLLRSVARLNPPEVSTLAHYNFEDSGTIASDSSGNGLAATTYGSSWVAGHSGNAISLSGASGSYVDLPDGILAGQSDFTVAAWVYWKGGSAWQRIFDFGNSDQKYMFLSPMSSGTPMIRFAITTGSWQNEQQISGSAALPTGSWQHVAVTLSGNTGTLYLNGAQVGQNTSMTFTPFSLGSTSQNYIGKSQYNDPYFNGLVDDFRIYGRALSVSEIAQLYYGTLD